MLPDEELIKKKLMKLIKVSFKSRQPDVMAVKCLDASIMRLIPGDYGECNYKVEGFGRFTYYFTGTGNFMEKENVAFDAYIKVENDNIMGFERNIINLKD